MAYENIQVAIEEGIALITISREKQLNALNKATLLELSRALDELAPRAKPEGDVRALIVTGAGEKSFVAGADIGEMASMTPVEGLEFAKLGHGLFAKLEALPIVTIAAVNGFALGGGCELAISFDLIYASERARFGQPEVNLGIIPGFGGTQRLARLLGKQRAKELIFTGELIDARRALEIGLATGVVAPEELIAHARRVAKTIASRGPLAIAQAKRAIEWGADGDLRASNELEQQSFALLFGSEDQKEGMRAFLEKRPASFKGR